MRFFSYARVLVFSGTAVLVFFIWALSATDAYAVTWDVSITTAGGGGGFDPQTRTINTGDTVRWTNNDSNVGQPASDDHTPHYNYPDPSCEFDAANCWDEEIAPTGTYSFTFMIAGTWNYHNHKKPGKTGTITVTDTNDPPAVTNVAATATAEDSIYLTWTSPGDDDGNFVNWGTPASYDIRYSLTGPISESEWSTATQAAGEPAPQAADSSESMTVTGLTASTEYYFALKATDDVPLTSVISNSPSATTLASGAAPVAAPTSGPVPDTQAPNPPKNVIVSAGDGFATFSWTNTLDADFSHVRIYRSETEGEKGDIVADDIADTVHTDSGLTNGVTYYYTLKSVDEPAGNESTNTTQVSATPAAATAVQETTASADVPNGGSLSLLEDGRLLFSLDIPPGAVDEPVDVTVQTFAQEDVLPGSPLPDGTVLVGTKIYEINVVLSFTGESAGILSPFAMELVMTYTDEDVGEADESDVRLAKYDEVNATWYVLEDARLDIEANRIVYDAFQLSRFALVRPQDSVVPASPTEFEGAASEGGVNVLTWTNPEDTDYHHVRLYRSENVNELGTFLGTVTGTRYNDGAASAGVDYTYAVFSVDTSGNISEESATAMVVSYIPDGELVQFTYEAKVWIVKRRGDFTFIRHLIDPQVPAFYVHLGTSFWDKVRLLERARLVSAQVSAWVRCLACAEEGDRVWEVNADGTRHWLDMTWEQFVERLGGDAAYAEAAIFEINEAEVAHYVRGADVLP